MKNRAYSLLTVKSVDEAERVIRGVATTPTPDRLGDIVEPLGVKYKNPLPLLWQHRSGEPVGTVKFLKPTESGIEFEARLPKIDEDGILKSRIDEAWQSVKHGLVKAVSIGFRAIERSYMDNGGIRFSKSEVFELSLVTIPANAEATITSIKSADREIRAAIGRNDSHTSGATGTKPKGNAAMWREKIEELKREIGPKRARMNAIMKEAVEDGDRELDESETQEFDDLSAEVKSLEAKLSRCKSLDDSAATVKPVAGRSTHDAGNARGVVYAEAKKTEEKGIGFARLVICRMAAAIEASKGNMIAPLDIARQRYPNMARDQIKQFEMILKVAGATTTDPDWAAPLAQLDNLEGEFLEFLRPMTILGKFGQGSIPSLHRIPFMVQFPAQVTGGDGYWVGEGHAKPLTRFNFEMIELRKHKVANIAVLSEELIRFSRPNAEMVVRNALAGALRERLDRDFVNPAIGPATATRPAAITYLATTSVSSGNDAAAVRADLKTLLAPFITANIGTGGLVFIMRDAQALSLSLMMNDLGNPEFPGIGLTGGTLVGIPVITSQYVPAGVVIALAAPEIYLADDGDVSVDMSREASLEMIDTTPDSMINDGGSPSEAVENTLVSMFQTNSVALRAERMITWQRRRTAAVGYLTGVGWGNEVTSPPQAAI